MLNSIVQWAVRFRGIVVALSLMTLGYGIYDLSHAKYDVFPEFAAPQVEIQTQAEGLAPEQVEVLITQPIENELNGLPGIESMRSSSVQGLSLITLVFLPNQNIYLSRQAVAERLTGLAAALPQGALPPVMTPLTSSTGDLMTIGITSDRLSLVELRTLADWVIKQRLLAVTGVAKVGVFGGDVRQMQIQIEPSRLRRFGMAVDDIIAAAQKATGIRGAGFIDTPKERLIVKTEGQALTAHELARVAVIQQSPSDLPMNSTLGEVAIVADSVAPRISAASIMGKVGIVLNVYTQFGANTLETTRLVDAALADLRPDLEKQGVVLWPDLFRAANFIGVAVRNVRSSLLIGAMLVMVVLFIFLYSWRTAVISCTAIPLSLLVAVTLLQQMGFSLNTMTLGGLAIAIGEVVDDAVIGVENVLRRLRENKYSAKPLPTVRIILSASLEVRSAVVYATFAVCLVFVPILTMSGLAGRLFSPLAITYILAIMASLGVALTLTPAMCFYLLGNNQITEKEAPLALWLKRHYEGLLARVEQQPRWVLVGVVLFVVAGFATLPFLGGEFLPSFQEGHFIAHLNAPPGTTLQESLRLGALATDKLLRLDWVRSVAQRAGRANSDDPYGPNVSELEIDLKPLHGFTVDQAEEGVRNVLKELPLTSYEVNSFLSERISETLSGYTQSVVINITGNDLDVLDAKAKEVQDIMTHVPGAAAVQLQAAGQAPQQTVRLRPSALAQWGIDPLQVLDAVSIAYQGQLVGEIFDGNRVIAVTVVLTPTWRNDPNALGSLAVRNPAGTYVPLRELADIQKTTGRAAVLHEGAQRVQTITADVTGKDLQSFVAEAKKTIAEKVTFPPGTSLLFKGAAEAQSKSQHDLLVHSLLAMMGIVLLLSIVMGNLRNLMLVLLNLPFALVGGILMILLTGRQLSMGSLVGFVTLFGITLRNSIMMMSHFEHLIAVEGTTWNKETASRGASERLVPVLMTALVTGLGLLPLAVGKSAPGREIEGPMALVILGGLVTSTALNLIVLPALALRFGRFEKPVDLLDTVEGTP